MQYDDTKMTRWRQCRFCNEFYRFYDLYPHRCKKSPLYKKSITDKNEHKENQQDKAQEAKR